MEQVVGASLATQRFALQMIGLFAIVALTLALIGVFGVMSYAMSLRSKELAIRVALGAGRGETLRILFGQGLLLILAGLLTGFFGAVGLSHVLMGLLYQVGPRDPITFASAAAILAWAALAACAFPAKRALSIDPINALRHE
jgi:putative ABC transport system permease protein